ncbi:hypothetical protein AGMMS49573_01340 [Endomicrobiia bacterium]|nr:hypothetical protein AGMMS49573_01340 [Endomicrobiia bacterium]
MKSAGSIMVTSCCASYNQFIRKYLPEIRTFVLDTETTLYYIAGKVKAEHKDALTVFIGHCIAKKRSAGKQQC